MGDPEWGSWVAGSWVAGSWVAESWMAGSSVAGSWVVDPGWLDPQCVGSWVVFSVGGSWLDPANRFQDHIANYVKILFNHL